MKDPVYAAVAEHKHAFADFELVVLEQAPPEQNRAAFERLDEACRRLVQVNITSSTALSHCWTTWAR
jgi:hypothetical protein